MREHSLKEKHTAGWCTSSQIHRFEHKRAGALSGPASLWRRQDSSYSGSLGQQSVVEDTERQENSHPRLLHLLLFPGASLPPLHSEFVAKGVRKLCWRGCFCAEGRDQNPPRPWRSLARSKCASHRHPALNQRPLNTELQDHAVPNHWPFLNHPKFTTRYAPPFNRCASSFLASGRRGDVGFEEDQGEGWHD